MKIDNGTPRPAAATGLRVAVITSSFNRSITDGLRAGAVAYLEEANAAEILSVTVPGAFELPLVAQKLALDGYDAVVCLGAVIQGDTDHYEHVAHRTSEGLMRVQLDTGVPIAFGVLTVQTADAARLRSAPGDDNKGREAAMAAVETAVVMANL
jgi:6,7-dimethyl-8-ribityllumazine synthase